MPPQDGLGAAAGRGATGLPTRRSGRCSSGPGSRAAGPKRAPTATSGPAPATCCTWTSAATRASSGPATASPATARSARATGCPQTSVGYDFAHAIVDDHSRLAYVELHPTRGGDGHRLRRARARLLRRARDHRQAADDRQRLQLRQEPLAVSCSPAAASATSPPSPTGRAPTARSSASTNDGARVGLRPRLPLTPTRNQALPHWLDHYNRRRPHSSLGDRPRSAAFTTSVGRTASRSRTERPLRDLLASVLLQEAPRARDDLRRQGARDVRGQALGVRRGEDAVGVGEEHERGLLPARERHAPRASARAEGWSSSVGTSSEGPRTRLRLGHGERRVAQPRIVSPSSRETHATCTSRLAVKSAPTWRTSSRKRSQSGARGASGADAGVEDHEPLDAIGVGHGEPESDRPPQSWTTSVSLTRSSASARHSIER